MPTYREAVKFLKAIAEEINAASQAAGSTETRHCLDVESPDWRLLKIRSARVKSGLLEFETGLGWRPAPRQFTLRNLQGKPVYSYPPA
jgi:hypothetical protein